MRFSLRTSAALVVTVLSLGAAPLPATETADTTTSTDAPLDLATDGAIETTGLRAGVSVVDATWHVGAAAGQYTDARDPSAPVTGGDVDPQQYATTKEASYGVQSRLTIRALVVEGSNGERAALVKSDNYLAQDHLLRRVGQLLAEGDSGVAYEDILHAASHNHSSPYYATPAAGVWLFEDVMDLRMFEYQARAMARAIEQAAAAMVPARMGATTITHDVYKGNITGPALADDGTPAGYPREFGDLGLSVLRFDDLSDPSDPQPLATWITWGQHPESLDSYDLISADFLAPLERFVEQDTGAPLLFSQGDVGSAEGPYTGWNRGRMEDGTLVAWAHVGYAQTERGARLLADAVVEAHERIGAGEGDVTFSTDVPVAVDSRWVPGPVSHPYPSVSNCRTETTAEGDPGAPVLGLPDCARAGNPNRVDLVFENLKAHGVPVPEHYDAPGFGAVEENLRLRLQTVRLGEVLLASCACEAQVDLILNLESRANDVAGDLWDGYDWGAACTAADDGATWTCERPGGPVTVSDAAYQRMQAQVHNDAAGWDDPAYAPYANSEPADPAAIKGNFTKRELDPEDGYRMVVGIGHAGDYNGYTVSYREYVSRDHYRKALTSYGPHTADYMVTRLVEMAGGLKGGPGYAGEPHDLLAEADEARQVAMAEALGAASSAAYEAWLASLPDDVGPAELLTQPEDLTRFDGASITWRGGSNAVDNPVVRVERQVGGAWVPFADMTGEVWTMVDLPEGVQGVADTRTGSQEWLWTAGFEAFVGGPDTDLPTTPAGTYRFVVDGHIRTGGATAPYELASEPFEVAPWQGIEVTDLAVDGTRATIAVAPVVYPRTYESPFPPIADDGREDLCRTCSFRAWAFSGEVTSVTVTVVRGGGAGEYRRTATRSAEGTWTVDLGVLQPGDRVEVRPGDVRDQAGNTNAEGLTFTAP